MTVVTNNTIQPASGQALTIKDEGGTASITVATNGEATFAENIKITANKGINFSAYGSEDSSSATTISSNLLDDYEEGTWTPNPKGATTAGTYSVQYRSAMYRKVGNVVHCDATIYVTSFTGAGDFQVDGLPFNVGSSSPGALVLTQWNASPFATYASDNQQVVGLAPANNDYIHFRASDRVYSGAYVQLQCDTSPSAITYLRLSFTYHTD